VEEERNPLPAVVFGIVLVTYVAQALDHEPCGLERREVVL
jgi:hypothetical protein